MKVRIMQQGSGPGSVPVGTILEVSDEEGRGMCATTDSQRTPYAVPVVEDRAEQRPAPEDKRTETREDKAAEKPEPPEPEPPKVEEKKAEEPEPEPRRGPGRPPGSTNRPKPS